ncbi:hypothetical protein JQC92_19870 [Shewanella sp. 202IG2-18]|uniref:hypothetical protein n=1 Tax=Parashewanella hymeniacidonis TaxID=2807618 RepID=UPI001961A1A6|nr:hypothetical protein [Parashewanella hymeniacidonis]MBM7074256.1 hypothetical protein [Parashewanella hymeniacidonis]
MSRLLKLLFLIVLAYGGYQWYNKSELIEQQLDWQSYKFKTQNVTAKFPVQPTVKNKSIKSSSIEFAGVRSGKTEFSVTVITGGSALRGDYYPDSLVKKGAQVLSNNNTYIDSHYTQEYELVYNGRSVIQRFIHFNDSLVTQTAFYLESEYPTESAQKFLDSISL